MKWHKYSEEQPKEVGPYLVTVKYGEGVAAAGTSIVWMMYWFGAGWTTLESEPFESNETHRIVAWMEEPQPYYEKLK